MSPKIQVQIGEVIATIADNDFPADWADLVPVSFIYIVYYKFITDHQIIYLEPSVKVESSRLHDKQWHLKTVHMLFKG